MNALVLALLLAASVNGKAPAPFILYTGAASTTIEKEYAAANGIAARGTERAMGASGSIDVGLAQDVAFTTRRLV